MALGERELRDAVRRKCTETLPGLELLTRTSSAGLQF